jgi:hypothetical protein
MPAPKGHPLWGNPINPKKYTPEEVWNEFVDYVEWAKTNPWKKQDFIKSGEMAGQIVELAIERPLSIEGFCLYAGITSRTFKNYSSAEGYETYFQICTHIKDICDAQNTEGGMVGAFNASLVAMRLGLKQRNDITSNGEAITAPTIIVQSKQGASDIEKL